MTFKTFRPAAMIIEKSSNFGRTWKTYGYFASNCAESFPEISTDKPKNLGELYCESKYSMDTPSSKGEVIFFLITFQSILVLMICFMILNMKWLRDI